MDTLKRRDFLKGLAALSASTFIPQAGTPRIIDVHQHYSSPAYSDLLVKHNAITVNQFRNYTPQRNLDQMDKAGIATAMLSPTAPAVWFGDVEEARKAARELNEYAAAKMVGGYKNRFGLFATLPMPDVDGTLKEIEYAFDTLKADGAAFLTSYDNKWLGDKAFDPIFDELNRRNAIVYTHPLEAACCKNPIAGVSAQTLEYPTDTTRIIMNLIVSNTATRCPNIKFIFHTRAERLFPLPNVFWVIRSRPKALQNQWRTTRGSIMSGGFITTRPVRRTQFRFNRSSCWCRDLKLSSARISRLEMSAQPLPACNPAG
jgi:hypothetical protein